MSGHENHNIKAFTEIAADLREHYLYEVVSPHEVALPDGCTSVANNPEHNHEYHEWIKSDLIQMLTCSTIAMMDGWEKSVGAKIELNAAIACGLKVMRVTPKLYGRGLLGKYNLRAI